jgi:prevent-host-death family protein
MACCNDAPPALFEKSRRGLDLGVLHDYLDHSDYRRICIMPPATWTVAEAKAKLSEVIERAQSGGPQTITKNGRTAVVVVDALEWERKTKRRGSLAEFFAASPLPKSGLKITRSKEKPRKMDL